MNWQPRASATWSSHSSMGRGAEITGRRRNTAYVTLTSPNRSTTSRVRVK